MSEINGKEIDRFPNYIVLSRRRATLVFADLLASRQKIESLSRLATSLQDERNAQANLLSHALHELALTRNEKDPQTYMQHWLSEHRTREDEAQVAE
jgi:hypothetical protein